MELKLICRSLANMQIQYISLKFTQLVFSNGKLEKFNGKGCNPKLLIEASPTGFQSCKDYIKSSRYCLCANQTVIYNYLFGMSGQDIIRTAAKIVAVGAVGVIGYMWKLYSFYDPIDKDPVEVQYENSYVDRSDEERPKIVSTTESFKGSYKIWKKFEKRNEEKKLRNQRQLSRIQGNRVPNQ